MSILQYYRQFNQCYTKHLYNSDETKLTTESQYIECYSVLVGYTLKDYLTVHKKKSKVSLYLSDTVLFLIFDLGLLNIYNSINPAHDYQGM